ncbi:MAG: FtsW/RodA/SpoVE family cell cycle protein [Candidatus Liptonbacteria bacterium]|nr:FtsW/RodA/SpoVE family cell cycle protein [Candidatus Liptonbacteria bacterium]
MLALFAPVLFLLLASLIMLASISWPIALLQLLWATVGVGVVVLLRYWDWRSLLNYRWLTIGLYLLLLAVLGFILLRGPLVRNVRGWLVWGPLMFQPVELMKVVLILLYAQFFSYRHIFIARLGTIFASLIFFAVPAGLTLVQPDLGQTVVLFAIWLGYLLCSGLPLRRIMLLVGLLAAAGVMLWFVGLKDYHRARITAFFYPERDALGINYSLAQSKIAIGSAGPWGKGFGQGTQTQLGFLTVPSNDFILAALTEEWGWSAALAVLAAVTTLVISILRVGLRAPQNFEKFVCLGVALVVGAQFLLNAGSVTGLLPVIGIPFPFLSHGGANLLTLFLLLGMVNAIRTQSTHA